MISLITIFTWYADVYVLLNFRSSDFDFDGYITGNKFQNSNECFAYAHYVNWQSAVFQNGNCHKYDTLEIVESIQGKNKC